MIYSKCEHIRSSNNLDKLKKGYYNGVGSKKGKKAIQTNQAPCGKLIAPRLNL